MYLFAIQICPSEISLDVTFFQQPSLTAQGWFGASLYVSPLTPCALPHTLLQSFAFVFVYLSKVFKGRDCCIFLTVAARIYSVNFFYWIDGWMVGQIFSVETNKEFHILLHTLLDFPKCNT